MDFVVTATNSSIAIAAAIVVATDPRAVPVLLVPALSVFALYRAYVSERQRHEQLEFLYEANRSALAVARGRRGDRGASSPARWRRSAARSRRSSCSAPTARRCGRRTGPGDERVTMVEADREAAEELAALVDRDAPVVSLSPAVRARALRAHARAARGSATRWSRCSRARTG